MSIRHRDDPPPTWFRLSPESWAMVRSEYLAGATARDLARKYRTSPSSIYRHASEDGWTKEKLGDAMARAHAASPAGAPPELADVTPPQPAHLAQAALTSLSAALSLGRATDARALVSVAESMHKRAEEEARLRYYREKNAVQARQREEEALVDWYRRAARLARDMTDYPDRALSMFVRAIARHRQEKFGESQEASLARACENAAAARPYFNLDDAAWNAGLEDGRRTL